MNVWEVDLNLRHIVYARFREWQIAFSKTPDSFNHLANLLGYESIEELQDGQNEHDEYLMRLLVGPHGFVIYQMLLRKRNMKMASTDKVEATEVSWV